MAAFVSSSRSCACWDSSTNETRLVPATAARSHPATLSARPLNVTLSRCVTVYLTLCAVSDDRNAFCSCEIAASDACAAMVSSHLSVPASCTLSTSGRPCMRTMTSCDDGDDPTRVRKAASIVGRFIAPRSDFPGSTHADTRATATTILRHHCSRLITVFLLRHRRAACSTRTEADVLGIPPNRPKVNEDGNSQARTALDSRVRREHPSVHPSHWTNILGGLEQKDSGGNDGVEEADIPVSYTHLRAHETRHD